MKPEELTKKMLLEAINQYSEYIMYNAENNEQFGKGWYPVCFYEFLNYEFVEGWKWEN